MEQHSIDKSSILDNARMLERQRGLSVADFERRYAVPHKPALLTDVIDHWPARKWTPETFVRKWGDKKLILNGQLSPLRDIIEDVMCSSEENPAPYLRNINVRAEFLELLPDLHPVPKYCKHNRLETRFFPKRILHRGEGRYTQLFIGGAGRAFPQLHWDSPPFHTWSALLYGRKEWVMFPPEDSENMYLQEDCIDVSQVSDVYNIDLDKYPQFAHTNPVRVVQEPGECLFVPAHWWHTAKNLEPSITIAWDQLCHTSWGAYSKHMLDMRRDKPLKAAVLAVYFAMVGSTLSLFERAGLGNV